MDVDRSVDYTRVLVAIRNMGLRGNPVGDRRIRLLFPSRRLSLSAMPYGIQTARQGGVLRLPYA